MAWIETVVNGLLLGGLYGLIGIGLALVFGVMRVVDGAQGEFMVMAAFFAVIVLAAAPDLHPLIIFGLAILFSFCIGYVYQSWIVNRSMQSSDPLAPLLLTFGVSIILRSVMVEVFGADLRGLQLGSLSRASIAIFNINIGVMPLLTLATSIALFLLLQWMLKRTSFGRIIRATADRRDIVRLFGVRPDRVYACVMAMSVALSAIAGLFLAARASFTPFSGVERLLIAFEVVVLGGIGSFWGPLIGGLALGVTQLVGLKWDPNAGLLYCHLLFFIMILIRPSGLVASRS